MAAKRRGDLITRCPIEAYPKVKATNPNDVILFHIGDFYEAFYADATDAARILGLTITTRKKAGEAPVPMAGFPHHMLARCLGALVKAGRRVAVVEFQPA